MIYVRAIHFAATMMAAGVGFFIVCIAEPAFRNVNNDTRVRATVRSQLAWVAWLSLALAVISGAAWLVLAAQAMSDRPLREVFSEGILWTVLARTDFGRDWLARLVLAWVLAAAFAPYLSAQRVTSGWLNAAVVVLAATFVGTLAWAGHAAGGSGMEAIVHPTADVLHLVAAATWVGALVPLALLLGAVGHDDAPVAIARTATIRFSTLGIASVATLLVTGSINTWYLAGSIPALVGTFYGRLLLAKATLFFAMVAIAAVNRLRLTPRLVQGASVMASRNVLRQLRRNTAIETLLGAIIIVIVAVLGTNPPGLHQQPAWPFPARLNLTAFSDPQLRISLLMALGAMAAGAFLIVAGFLVRRSRWPAIVIGAAVIVYFVPSLRPLLTAAYPTTYYTSPVPFTAQSIADGERLFAVHCASCHGVQGRGDGPAGTAATTRPADLAAAHVYDHSDGDLFWWISNGIDGVMPQFGPALDDQALWNVINFLRVNADAVRLRTFAAGTQAAFPSPNFSADCSDGSTISVGRGPGRIVHVVAAGAGTDDWLRQIARSDMQHDVSTVVIALDRTPELDLPICGTQDPNVIKTFALYAGSDLQKNGVQLFEGTEFLIDRDGNLRSMWHPAREPGLTEPDSLTQRLEALRLPPVVVIPADANSHVHVH